MVRDFHMFESGGTMLRWAKSLTDILTFYFDTNFLFWNCTPFRQRLHERSFKSTRFHDFEPASKTMRFRVVYTEPIQAFSRRWSHEDLVPWCSRLTNEIWLPLKKYAAILFMSTWRKTQHNLHSLHRSRFWGALRNIPKKRLQRRLQFTWTGDEQKLSQKSKSW